MHVYPAGIYTTSFDLQSTSFAELTDAEKAARLGVTHFLESYFYLRDNPRAVEKIRTDRVKIFLDSGAYSAYTKGATIKLDDYCDFIREHEDITRTEDGVRMVSVLDVIGDPVATLRNQERMEDELGFSPIPCFHFGEPTSYLEQYIEKYEYVALGGMADKVPEQLDPWLKEVLFGHILGDDGKLRCRAHGFGLMSVPLLRKYRGYFASVDSTTWLQWARFGTIYLPGYGRVAISEQSPAREHFDAVYASDDMRAVIEAKGFEVERLRTRHQSRWCWNLAAFQAAVTGVG
jgi:hypothetical protein